jgi:hypothetical protein
MMAGWSVVRLVDKLVLPMAVQLVALKAVVLVALLDMLKVGLLETLLVVKKVGKLVERMVE